MRIYNPPDNIRLLLYRNLLLDNERVDDEDDLNPKLNNLHTDYPEGSRLMSFVRLMF
jgi:hypothetical protein